MPQIIRLSTTDTFSESENPQVITVINRALYGDEAQYRQPDETLSMLRAKAQEMGASAVVGVRLVPLVDDRGAQMMMAYGTAVTKARP